MIDRLILEFILRLVFKHGNTKVLMKGSIFLYILWIPPLGIGILRLNFTEALRLGLC